MRLRRDERSRWVNETATEEDGWADGIARRLQFTHARASLLPHHLHCEELPLHAGECGCREGGLQLEQTGRTAEHLMDAMTEGFFIGALEPHGGGDHTFPCSGVQQWGTSSVRHVLRDSPLPSLLSSHSQFPPAQGMPPGPALCSGPSGSPPPAAGTPPPPRTRPRTGRGRPPPHTR